jgi:hypothetical protein
MSQWAPAGTVASLFEAATPVAAAAPISTRPLEPTAANPVIASAVGYYTPGGGIPPRAASTLMGYAKPTGDTGDWPLDDARVDQFEQTLKLRKKVTGAGQLYRALLVLTLIAAVIILMTAGFATVAGPRSAMGLAGIAMGFVVALLGAFCALYFFTWRATMRAKRWAPLTMFILYLVGMAGNLVSIAAASSASGPDVVGAYIGNGISLLIGVAFAVVSWKAYAAIPKYLAQPAWCQELLIKSKL